MIFCRQDCVGYQDVPWKVTIFNILCVLSLGTLVLVVYWKPEWRVYMTKSRCPLSFADTVFLTVS